MQVYAWILYSDLLLVLILILQCLLDLPEIWKIYCVKFSKTLLFVKLFWLLCVFCTSIRILEASSSVSWLEDYFGFVSWFRRPVSHQGFFYCFTNPHFTEPHSNLLNFFFCYVFTINFSDFLSGELRLLAWMPSLSVSFPNKGIWHFLVPLTATLPYWHHTDFDKFF